jgi:predicted transcriptional regulator
MPQADSKRAPPAQVLTQLLQGKVVSKALSVVAELGVADHVKSTPTSIDEIAAHTGTHADSLYRVLRLLAAVGVFAESHDRAFALTPVSELLRTDARGSLRPMARWQDEHNHYTAWGELEHAVRTGKPGFDKAHGVQVFEFMKSHFEVARIFDEAMGGFTVSVGAAVAKAYDFSGVKHVVDIGGSHGVLLAALLDRYPHLRATLYDLPHVIEAARKALATAPHAGRIEALAGDFLEGVPKGADAYIMKSIIHDWDDEHCVALLSRCREAMAPGGRVLVVEGLVTDAQEDTFLKVLDLEMLVMTTGGRERTHAELAALMRKARLDLVRVVRTESPMSVAEAHAR